MVPGQSPAVLKLLLVNQLVESIRMTTFPSIRMAACVALFGICCAATTAQGQFTTIYNIPPDVLPATIGSNTQINVFEGG
jgi:hypothetical protein